jgi:hypothetical protein
VVRGRHPKLVHPGDKIIFDKMPRGEVRIRAVRPAGRIEDFFGSLKCDGRPSLSIDEMNEVTEKGWAGEL